MARDTKLEVDIAAEDALDAIYREHFEFVSCALHRFGVSAGDLDDATQDVFVVAHGKLGSFEGRAEIRTWLYSIAVRVASNRRRKHVRRDALLVRLPRPIPDDLEELAARGQARKILEGLLDRLDEHKRVVFVLAELEEMTVPAIARIVGENPRTVYSRLRAARARVASELDRLQLPAELGLDEAITAARPRPVPTPERAPRVWAGVLATLAGEAVRAPVLATTGLSLVAKLAIAGGLAATVATAIAVAIPEPPPQPSIAAAPARVVEPSPLVASAAPTPSAAAPPIVGNVAPTPTVAPPQPRAMPSKPSPASDPPPAAPRSLADEVAAIDRARELLATGRADDALAELDRYAARFSDGRMRGEATTVRVAALCKAGRAPEAAALASAERLPTPRCTS